MLLRDLAQKQNLAVAVADHVADRLAGLGLPLIRQRARFSGALRIVVHSPQHSNTKAPPA